MAGEHTVEFADATFEEEVINSDKPVLVDFWAEWCGPCKQLAPLIDELASHYEGKVKVGKLDTDANRETSMKHQISAIPTVMLFHKGEVVEKFVGLRSKKDFMQALDRLVGA